MVFGVVHCIGALPMRAFAAAAATFLLALSAGFAQEVSLPAHTGTLTPDSTWTVLRTKDIVAEERPTDPTAEPARTGLRNMLAQLRSNGETADKVILHSIGPAGQLRAVHAYSLPGCVPTQQLRAAAFLQAVRQNAEDGFAQAGIPAAFHSSTPTSLCGAGGVRIRYAVADGEAQPKIDTHIMPAYPRTQWFVATYTLDDETAPDAIDALLATFNGAKDPPSPRRATGEASRLGIISTIVGISIGAMMFGIRGEGGKRRRRRNATK
jgi:hypothetical protein